MQLERVPPEHRLFFAIGGLGIIAGGLVSAVAGPRWARWTFRATVVVLLVSIPIGLVLAHLRSP